jgi:pyruvate/2-oxoglutarate dehydrogenase complex dihydrolipoamide acyltransferase (E2) component/uncharacterized OsmC-like protein
MTVVHEIVMPQLGQAMESGVVAAWKLEDGSKVVAGETIAIVESDKASYDIEAAFAGTLSHIVDAGAEVNVGEPIATIAEAGGATPAGPIGARTGRLLASPKARVLAKTLDVDLNAISSRRLDGLLVAQDVEAAATASRSTRPFEAREGRPLSSLRRTAADRLARSWRQAPHFVQMVEVNASRLSQAMVLIREKRLGCTLNDILIKVAADTLAQFPDLNARIADDALVMSNSVSVGLAVATDEGLTVPVLRDVDKRSLSELAKASADLVVRARKGGLAHSDFGKGSLTVSNLGRYGVAFGTPVLNLDEPILIFVGAIEERPVGEAGRIVLRPMTTLSVCYDHRVADGLRAAQFSGALKRALEDLDGIVPVTETGPRLAQRELHASSASGLSVAVRARTHHWLEDEPKEIGGADGEPDPVSFALGGLLSCMIAAVKLTAKRSNIEVDKIEGRLTATPTGKVREVRIALDVWAAADPSEVVELLDLAKTSCLLHDLMSADLRITIVLNVRRD